MDTYGVVVGVLVLGVCLVGAVYAVAALVGTGLGPLTGEPFLSGMAPVEHAASRYHMRWYPVTIVFLAFDMEMIFMFPWTRVVTEVGTPAVVEMFGFLAILLIGVGYAVREGALRWT